MHRIDKLVRTISEFRKKPRDLGAAIRQLENLLHVAEAIQNLREFPSINPDEPRPDYYLYDLHGHTVFSDGMLGPIGKMLYCIYATNLDGIAYTDHNNWDAYMVAYNFLQSPACEEIFKLKPNPKPHFEIFPGIEISAEHDAHIIGIFDPEYFREQYPRWSRMGHFPKGMPWLENNLLLERMRALKLSPHADAKFPGIKDLRGVGDAFLDPKYRFDAVETKNAAFLGVIFNANVARRNQAAEKPLAVYGGSDSHIPGTEGYAATEVPEPGFEGLTKAFAERTSRAYGHVWTPVDFVRGPLKYYKFYKEASEIPQMKKLLRDPMTMYAPVLEYSYKNLQRAVQYFSAGEKVKTTSFLFPSPPLDPKTGKIIEPFGEVYGPKK